MPPRTDIHKILLIGSGPIVIGQACEFDYSGTQGAKALAALGYSVVLVNSNPATIMTDPGLVARTYIEAINAHTVRAIIERERPDALLPTLGGQTALNVALELHAAGVLADHGVQLIGADVDAIRTAEDRALFKQAVARAGLASPRSGVARSVAEAWEFVGHTGFPAVLRPSFTLGGAGGAIVEAPAELERHVRWALAQSPTGEVLVEESLVGWKEYELEVIRDRADNFIVVCAIENLDPMGVHTGDSITVAPAMTLTDREYQHLRDAARAIMLEIGVDTGGANVQFAVDPRDGRVLVIEMNPRVSRSSALASKATGYPIAKIAAQLAVGMTLDELRNDITGTSAAFEPTLDYVVVKWPRFAFEKFPGAEHRLGTQMRSVGEVMSIGRSFAEALQKAARSLEIGRSGLDSLGADPARLLELIATPTPDRLFHVGDALRAGATIAAVHAATGIDPWFLHELARIVGHERALAGVAEPDAELLRASKRLGFSDVQIGRLIGRSADEVRARRRQLGVTAVYGRVDTCAAELPSRTPYLYSCYETACEADVSDRAKIIILGGGPNRIGQGIEFDYCCCQAAFAARHAGFETVMINCNPETVSTDYDTSDRLYFEPLTLEDVLAVCEAERARGTLVGVIVQLGGQTPLGLAVALRDAGIPLLGTPADAIDRAEDRARFDHLLGALGIARPRAATATTVEDAVAAGCAIGLPVLVRPSYVLGGRAMAVCHTVDELRALAAEALAAGDPLRPRALLIDEFLRDAIEVDVDCVADGARCVIGGVMQHVEHAGVHSGDSACILPPATLAFGVVAAIEATTRALARELGIVGLMNVQLAVQGDRVLVLEVNPRASRTVPFVAKATGFPLAWIATQVMAGRTLDELGVTAPIAPRHVAVKESVFVFHKFAGSDPLLGPEMRSTGEVMGIARNRELAFAKSQLATGFPVPRGGRALIDVLDDDLALACLVAGRLHGLGFELAATDGTARRIAEAGFAVHAVGSRADAAPAIAEALAGGSIQLLITTCRSGHGARDSAAIRRAALLASIPYYTTMSAAVYAVEAIESLVRAGDPAGDVRSIQEWHAASAA
jgi:carbamoyl-phosphate synthase large subunit